MDDATDKDSTVGVYAANPGLVDTDLRRNMPSHNAFFSRKLFNNNDSFKNDKNNFY